MFRFREDQLSEKFGKDKATIFLRIFTCERRETNFLFYAEQNLLYFKPIFQIDQHTYQVFELKHLILAIYNVLTSYCLNNSKIKGGFIKHRGNMLENKVEALFRNFFSKNVTIHNNYYTDKDGEQDLLIFDRGAVFIVEAKADKLDEPRRDPDKAYPLLLQNFKVTIQKGYDQCYRVKQKFINKEILSLYEDESKQKKIVEIRTKICHNVFLSLLLWKGSHIFNWI